ncbi:hypothetical protein [Methylobacterium sp. J-068]|uniref:hypothetical protein n=1 Tax=Methylobacterium sp. J-068 TaxID=2836649 RepID=UPI001FBB2C76|nr:hypothetical protein [Methylobacterium sp. J-068]MCJ2033534.1 hypothetical protein [Methylobacterium sp. J-068]
MTRHQIIQVECKSTALPRDRDVVLDIDIDGSGSLDITRDRGYAQDRARTVPGRAKPNIFREIRRATQIQRSEEVRVVLSDPLNRDCFFPPKLHVHEQTARGFSAHGQSGGMSHIQRVHLSLGQNYFRFCDSDRFAQDPNRAAAGGWWADYEIFSKVAAAARTSGTMQDYAARQGQSALSYAAKLYFAIPYEWGDCGTIVVARLDARLDAFRGRGLTAYLDKQDPRDGGAKYTPIQDATVSQLYIPELHRHFGRAFTIVKTGAAASFL